MKKEREITKWMSPVFLSWFTTVRGKTKESRTRPRATPFLSTRKFAYVCHNTLAHRQTHKTHLHFPSRCRIMLTIRGMLRVHTDKALRISCLCFFLLFFFLLLNAKSQHIIFNSITGGSQPQQQQQSKRSAWWITRPNQRYAVTLYAFYDFWPSPRTCSCLVRHIFVFFALLVHPSAATTPAPLFPLVFV